MAVSDRANDFGRHPDGNAFRRYVAAHDGPGPDDRAVADADAGEDDGPIPNPNIVSDMNAPREKVAPMTRRVTMIQGRDGNSVADVDAVADIDPALVLNGCKSVDENIVSKMKVPPIVEINRAEKAEALGFFPDESKKGGACILVAQGGVVNCTKGIPRREGNRRIESETFAAFA